MSRKRPFLLVCTVAALAAVQVMPAQEEEPKYKVKNYSSEGARVHLNLPTAWTVRAQSLKWNPNRSDQHLLKLSCKAPKTDSFTIDVTVVPGALRPLHYARLNQTRLMTATKSKKAIVGAKPVPHLVLDRDADSRYGDTALVLAFQHRNGYGVHVHLECKDADLAKVKADFLEGAQSADCTLPRVPVVPKDQYEIEEEDGVLFCLAPGVDKGAVRHIERTMRTVQGYFEKAHPEVEWPEDSPLQLIVDMRHDAADRLAKVPQNKGITNPPRRIIVVPWDKPKTTQEDEFVHRFAGELYCELYGSYEEPRWTAVGETIVARMVAASGKKPPYAALGFVDLDVTLRHRLDFLATPPSTERALVDAHAVAYVLMFRAGPSKYRRAYKDFLEAYYRSGDFETALKEHIYVLDQDRLLRDARTFLQKRVKRVKWR